MTESPIYQGPIAYAASKLEHENKILRDALKDVQAGDPHGYLSAGLEAGFRAADLADRVQAQLHHLDRMTDVSPAEVTMGREMVKDVTFHLQNVWIEYASILETRAQDELDFIATVIEQSPLTETDRAEQNVHAWMHMWQAHELRVKKLQMIVEEAEYDLRRAEVTHQVALLTLQPADQIAELEQTIAELRLPLDGDPAAAARVQELLAERETLLLRQGRGDTLTILTILLPKHMRPTRINHEATMLRLDAIEREVDTLMEQVGLHTRRDWAAADLSRITASFDTAKRRMADAVIARRDLISLQSPMQQMYLAELKAKIARWYPPGSPAYDALLELEAVLDTRDTAVFIERYAVFAQLMEDDPNLSVIVGNEFHEGKAFNNDPRLDFMMGRFRFVESIQLPFDILAQDGFLNQILLGTPSLARNVLVFQQPDISPELREQHLVGLNVDLVVTSTSDVLHVIETAIDQLEKSYWSP